MLGKRGDGETRGSRCRNYLTTRRMYFCEGAVSQVGRPLDAYRALGGDSLLERNVRVGHEETYRRSARVPTFILTFQKKIKNIKFSSLIFIFSQHFLKILTNLIRSIQFKEILSLNEKFDQTILPTKTVTNLIVTCWLFDIFYNPKIEEF